MNLRHVGWTALAAFAVLTAAGCRKSPPDQPAPPKPSAAAPAPEQTSRLHWLGKQRLAAEAKAAGLMSIWNLPESSRLEAQTLDRLALAPWRLLKGDDATNGAPAALLRAVLDDLVREESWLEIRHATNPPGELAFAIRLSDAQAASWETNLATVFESLTGVKPAAAAGRRGWSLQKAGSPQRLELTRAGEWTLLGLAQERNALLADVVARLERDRVPFPSPTTNLWLDADVDLRRIARAFALAWPLPAQWPRLTLTAAAGTNLSLRGQMHFPDPLPFEVEAWNIPTNLIHHPLHSFTAIQGLRPWLGAWKVWNDLQLGDPPNQLFFWAQQQAPALTYGAAPMPKAANAVSTLATYVLSNAGPWIAAHRMGKLETPADADGLAWTGIPFMAPFVKSVAGPLGDFAFGGLAASTLTNRPPPPGVLREFLSQTNLVLYDRELTGPRVEGWLYNSQTLRLMCWRAQFPAGSASMKWLQAVAPKLGNSTTLVSKTGPAQLSFTRESSIGLTALEMHVLGEWLESPQFPRGFHTLLAKPPAPPRRQREGGTQELRNPASIRPPR